MCHPDRSEAEWGDLLFQLFPPDQSQNVYAANCIPGTQGVCLPVRSHFGNPTKNILKKWQISVAQNRALKSPQSTIHSPQTHHELTIKKHHIFLNPPSKKPCKTHEIRVQPVLKKNHKSKSAADRQTMPQERILVVDDEEAVRDVIAALLERSGYSATLTGSAEEAMARLQQDPDYDLVLSDIMMPGIDGLCLLDHLCTDHPGMPVVMFSAINDIHVVTNAFRRGAIDYLLKPFERAELESIVMRGVEHGRLRKQNTIYRQNLESIVTSRTGRLRSTMQDLERSYDITLEAMGDALDLRDEETEGHSKRVTAYTIALAQAIGLESDELRIIARGAFLHDIGKIATPDSILLKPGKLTDEEMAIMKEHCERGYQMVRKIPFLREAAEIVHAHQERFDGTGYPRGLRGEEIPLGARIFAIADSLDAMTSDRPYRKGSTFAAAKEEIVRCAGTQFDPQIVEVFLAMPNETWSELRTETGKLSPSARSASLCHPAVAPSKQRG
jgi:putative nucleotidyltransferase with HDIG domain